MKTGAIRLDDPAPPETNEDIGMDAEHYRAVELAAAQECELTRLRADLDRAEVLLDRAGIDFERTPDRTRPWMNRPRKAAAPTVPGIEAEPRAA